MDVPSLSRKLPLIPYVQRFLMLNCQGTFMAYIEDEGQALDQVFLGLIDTSLKAFTRSMLRPKGLRSKPHFGTNTAELEEAASDELLPDLARQMGKWVKLDYGPIPPTYKTPLQALWFISDIVADAAYVALVFGLVKEFIYDSFHNLAKDPRNHCAEGWGNGRIANDLNRATEIGSWSPLLAFEEMRVTPPNFTVSDRMFMGPGLHGQFWGMTIKNVSAFLPVTLGLFIGDQTTQTWYGQSGMQTIGPGEFADLIVAADKVPEGEVICWVHAFGKDFFNVVNANVQIMYQGPVPKPPKPEPPNRAKTDTRKRGRGAPSKRKRARKQYHLKFTKYRS